jgi:UDP-glucuronate 4-epimerase
MSIVLVTGGAGFIGSHLCEKLLLLGHDVINIDNFNSYYDPLLKRRNCIEAQAKQNYKLIQGDIRDKVLLGQVFKKYKIDTIIHLAALAGVRKSIENTLEYVDVDIKGTVNLLEFSKMYNIKKFIFASTSSVYGFNGTPFKEEDSVISQASPYAVAKLSGELFCRNYNRLYGIPIVCLRFFTVYGPRQRPEMAIHHFTRCIEEGREVTIFGNGKSSRDYTYIEDIIQGIIASMQVKSSFDIFNLGGAEPVALNDLIYVIEKKLGKTSKKVYLGNQQGDVEHTYADITKAKKQLGYSPKVKLEEGIERFIHWYRGIV